LSCFTAFPIGIDAQVISNNGAVLTIGSSAVLNTKDIINTAGTIKNNGTINLTGNWTNTATYIPGVGTVYFIGSVNQIISNSSVDTIYNLVESNASGLTLSSGNVAVSNL